jgi:hypothetical protein
LTTFGVLGMGMLKGVRYPGQKQRRRIASDDDEDEDEDEGKGSDDDDEEEQEEEQEQENQAYGEPLLSLRQPIHQWLT